MVKRAVKSILAQTYRDLRVLVLDNASGDETPDVVAQLVREDSRVEYLCHAENIGMIGNFNAGLQRVDTPYFTMLSDDDICLPHFYECAMQGFEREPSAWFSAGVRVQVRAPRLVRDAPIGCWPMGLQEPPEGGLRLLRAGLPGVIDSVFRREVLTEVEGFPPAVLASDLDFMLRLALKHPYVIATTRPCVFFVFHDGPRGGHGDGCIVDELERAYDGMVGRIESDGDIAPAVRREVCAHLQGVLSGGLRSVAVSLARRGEFGMARFAVERYRRRSSDRWSATVLKTLISGMERTPGALSVSDAVAAARRRMSEASAVRNLRRAWPEGFDEACRFLGLLELS